MPNAFAAKFSDLSGPTNPTGIMSPAFLRLKRELDNGGRPDNVRQALYDWLSQRKIVPTHVDKILELPSVEHAYEALVALIGGQLQAKRLPVVVQQTLKRVVTELAQQQAVRYRQQAAHYHQQADTLTHRFGGESAEQIVSTLLES